MLGLCRELCVIFLFELIYYVNYGLYRKYWSVFEELFVIYIVYFSFVNFIYIIICVNFRVVLCVLD